MRRPAALFLAGWTLLVLLTTLSPVPANPGPSGFCLLCGERAIADALLNLALFVPAGFALARLGMRPRAVLVLALAFSGAVELVQIAIPGRYSTPVDVVANALGALAGGMAAGQRAPRGPLSTVAAFAAFSLLALAPGWLEAPRTPAGTVYAQWEPFLGGATYPGRVVSARIGDRLLPDGPLPSGIGVGGRLAAGETLAIRFEASPLAPEAAAVFALAEEGRGFQHVLAAVGADLVYRRAGRAPDLRLDQPFLLLPRVLEGVEVGDTVDVLVSVAGGETEVTAASPAGVARAGGRPAVTRGWSYLYSGALISTAARRLADALWILAITAPLGAVAGGTRAALVLGGLAGAFLLAAPLLAPVAPAPAPAAALAVVGSAAGRLVWRRTRRPDGPRTDHDAVAGSVPNAPTALA